MKILLEYFKLMRLDKLIGFILLFWPCAFGLAYASQFRAVPLGVFVLFLYGSIVMRSAGCIINDIIDRDLDRQVERTKNRPLAKGSIQIFDAIILAMLLFIAGAVILLSLGLYAIYIGLAAALLVMIYPFTKRFFNYPQLFLGITFNIGLLISFVYIVGYLNWTIIILYLACILWTLGYDTIYAYQDKKDDKKIGIKSTAISFDSQKNIGLYMCYGAVVTLLAGIGFYHGWNLWFFIFLLLLFLQLFLQVVTLDKNKPENCLQRFKSNLLAGLLIFLALLVA